MNLPVNLHHVIWTPLYGHMMCWSLKQISLFYYSFNVHTAIDSVTSKAKTKWVERITRSCEQPILGSSCWTLASLLCGCKQSQFTDSFLSVTSVWTSAPFNTPTITHYHSYIHSESFICMQHILIHFGSVFRAWHPPCGFLCQHLPGQ